MFWLLFLVAAGAGALYYRWQRRKLYQIHSELPSSATSYPIIGHTYLMKNSDAVNQVWFKTLGQQAIAHGGLTSFWLMNKLYIVVADPATSEVVLKNNNSMEKGYVTQFIRTVLGNGSIFAPVDIWRPRRKILAPVFSMKNLNQFVQTFNDQSKIMAELLQPMAGAGEFSVWRYFTTYTFDSVCETTLGIDLNSQKNPNHSFLIAFDWLSQEVARRMVTPWIYPDFVYQRLPIYKQFLEHRNNIYDFVDEIVRNKRNDLARIQQGDKKESDGAKTFLDMMIESSARLGKQYSDLELREEVMVILMAGTDTSAVGSSFAAVMLARYPGVQEKVHEELDMVFGKSDRALTVQDLPNLKYLEAVIKETLRLYPPIPTTVREVTSDVTLPSGTTLVAGVSVVLNIWATHRSPACWGPDADQFRPERFLEGPLQHPSQFQPFSLPMRNCLGYNYAMMSMKTMLANMLRRYRVLPPAHMDARRLREPLKVTFDIMMRDMDNYMIRLEDSGATMATIACHAIVDMILYPT